MMVLVNALQKEDKLDRDTIKDFIKILHPFAPFITEELWVELGEKPSILNEKWPTFDPTKTIDSVVTVVFQVNGKIRVKLELEKDTPSDKLVELALNNPRIKEFTDGKTIVNKIAIPNKLVNIVVK